VDTFCIYCKSERKSEKTCTNPESYFSNGLQTFFKSNSFNFYFSFISAQTSEPGAEEEPGHPSYPPTTPTKPEQPPKPELPQTPPPTSSTSSGQGAAAAAAVVTTPPPPPVAGVAVVAVVSGKVKVNLQAVGSAPILRKTKFEVGAHEKFIVIPTFLRKHLKLEESAPLFVYCNSAFCPNLDQRISDLYEVIHIRGRTKEKRRRRRRKESDSLFVCVYSLFLV
jgi:ubiquitin-like protein ATG12